ncbi:hypothetical protein GPALN_010770, partial [Globodera pallida]
MGGVFNANSAARNCPSSTPTATKSEQQQQFATTFEQIGHNANINGRALISSRSTSATLPIDQSHSTKTAHPSRKKETSIRCSTSVEMKIKDIVLHPVAGCKKGSYAADAAER